MHSGAHSPPHTLAPENCIVQMRAHMPAMRLEYEAAGRAVPGPWHSPFLEFQDPLDWANTPPTMANLNERMRQLTQKRE